MLEVERNSHIHLMTYSEIHSLSGFVGNYEVEVLQHPRYTNEKCNGCGACSDVCPVYTPSEFDQYLKYRKAAYVAFTQAVPMVAQIDMSKCIRCGLCEEVCELHAIDFSQQPQIEKLRVGTIIVATGYDVYKPKHGEYGYGIFKNVVTQMELERILAPNGPSFGHLVRPSDGKTPKRVLFIQCVGSRSLKYNKYCSSGVCCMVSIKNAKLIKQHDPEIDVTIAFIEIRAAGKGYEEYYLESRKYGIHYVKASVSRVYEDKETQDLNVFMYDILSDDRKVKKYTYDMVVLSSAMEPAQGIDELNSVLKLETTPDGFFKEFHARLETVNTPIPGISLAGASHGPKSIAETIMQSKGAASSAGGLMSSGKYTMVMQKAVVDDTRCSKCGICAEICPYEAIIYDMVKGPEVDEIKCRGCGMCAMSCPSSAITLRNQRNTQFRALIDNLLYSALDDKTPT